MKPLRIVEPAEIEYQGAATWYRDRDSRVAERFVTETRRALELTETFPRIGGRVPGVADPDVRQIPIHSFPYHLVFVRLSDRLEVVAAHSRRSPGYFADRLPRK